MATVSGTVCKQGVVGSSPFVSTRSDQGISRFLRWCQARRIRKGAIRGANGVVWLPTVAGKERLHGRSAGLAARPGELVDAVRYRILARRLTTKPSGCVALERDPRTHRGDSDLQQRPEFIVFPETWVVSAHNAPSLEELLEGLPC